MKKIYLLTITAITILTIEVNAQSYQLTYTNNTYTPLAGGTSMNNGLAWDDLDFNVPLGFTFSIAGRSYDTLQTSGGFYFLGDSSFAGLGSVFVPNNLDLIDRGYVDSLPGGGTNSMSPISFQTTGLAGSRILKIQYENAGFYEEYNNLGTTLDSMNYQVWFYEGTNAVEVRFGNNSMRNDSLVYFGESGSVMAIVPSWNLTNDSLYGDLYYAFGDSTSPMLGISQDLDSADFLNGRPVNGGVYTFTPTTVALNNVNSQITLFSVYPNPAQNFITLELKDNSKEDIIQLFDLSGKVVFTEKVIGLKNNFDVSNLTRGVYFLRVDNAMKKVVLSK